MRRMCFIALLAFGLQAEAAEPPLLVSIGVTANANGLRLIHVNGKDATFPVVITNVSDKPLRIWAQWCSWGNRSIQFQLEGADGTKTSAVSAVMAWTMNFPDFYELKPGESSVTDIAFTDSYLWSGFTLPKDQKTTKLSMRVILSIHPDEDGKRLNVWNGTVQSEMNTYHFVREQKE